MTASSKLQPAKPFILMAYGFPGSGKTTFGKQLANEMTVSHVRADRIGHELFPNELGEYDSEKANQTALYIAHEFLRSGMAVFYDGTTDRASDRRAVQELARICKVPLVMVWIQIDPESAYLRTQNRDRRKSDEKYAKTYTQDSFESALANQQNPDNEKYVVISGKHTFHTQRAAVLKKLYELGIVSSVQAGQSSVVKPELVNLIPYKLGGRVDMSRRDISIR